MIALGGVDGTLVRRGKGKRPILRAYRGRSPSESRNAFREGLDRVVPKWTCLSYRAWVGVRKRDVT